MPRQPRLIHPNVPVHIVARGNYQQPVFLEPRDRATYLNLLAKHAAAFQVPILGWCLMTNHVHIIATPPDAQSLSEAMKLIQGQYSSILNARASRRSGHLWQSRFYSCPLVGADYLWTALRYVELNPVRACLVARAEHSDWSSAAYHCGVKPAPSLLTLDTWPQSWTPDRWRDVLHLGQNEREADALRRATKRGLPLCHSNVAKVNITMQRCLV